MHYMQSFLKSEDTANSGSCDHTDAIRIKTARRDASIADSFTGSDHGKLGVEIQLLYFFMVKVFIGIVVLYFCGNLGGESGSIKSSDHTNAGYSIDQALPGLGNIVANRCNSSHSGNHNSSFCHINLICLLILRISKQGLASFRQRIS
jgi:hypothetical protein